ncbi:aspartate/glutamate racemase family protein [Ammoniphilus sp. 3BR4]|uniref:aspartate/glutamate racemase family protein n=1 Tax=Ammoniphilus sp. 3BR4 TaxID=3158265 RepID=UPI0034669EA7
MNKTVGILGGMGPMATVDLFRKIIESTPAKTDQDHLKIIIYNNPQIPSRNQEITGGKEDPLFELIRSARLLESSGADFILIPCHAAHYWIESLRKTVDIPICSMIDITVDYVEKYHEEDSILLLANTNTLKRKLFEIPFRSRGLHLLYPKPDEQGMIVSAINDVKAGFISKNKFIQSLNDLIKHYCSLGVTSVIGGCTEIPLLFPFLEQRVKMIDPTELLASRAVALARDESPNN